MCCRLPLYRIKSGTSFGRRSRLIRRPYIFMLAAHRLVWFRSASIVRYSLSRYATNLRECSEISSEVMLLQTKLPSMVIVQYIPVLHGLLKHHLTTDFPRNNKTIVRWVTINPIHYIKIFKKTHRMLNGLQKRRKTHTTCVLAVLGQDVP